MARLGNAITIAEIEQILYAKKPQLDACFWTAEGIECWRDRHRYSGQPYTFNIEVLRLKFSQPGKSAWEAFIVNERWMAGIPETLIRGNKWLKIVSGKSSDVRDWIRGCRPLRAA
jgi:hypothetical protein